MICFNYLENLSKFADSHIWKGFGRQPVSVRFPVVVFFRHMTWKSTQGKSNYFLRHCKFAKMECTMYYYVSFFLKNSFFNLILSLSSNLKIIWWVMLLWYGNCLWKGMYPEGYDILFYTLHHGLNNCNSFYFTLTLVWHSCQLK